MTLPRACLAAQGVHGCLWHTKKAFPVISLTSAGGTSLFTGVRERLERELLEVAPQAAKVKVTSPMNLIERRFSVWIGACAWTVMMMTTPAPAPHLQCYGAQR